LPNQHILKSANDIKLMRLERDTKMLANPSESAVRDLLQTARTIAVVGASQNPARPVHGVMRYLIGAGYELYPVNPGLAGQTLLGRRVYGRLAEVPVAVDIVDIFRRSDALGSVVDEALRLTPLPKAIWMQLGLSDDEAAARARAAGVTVVMDHCIKIEHARLL
jgi:predicted CoA-binding protein